MWNSIPVHLFRIVCLVKQRSGGLPLILHPIIKIVSGQDLLLARKLNWISQISDWLTKNILNELLAEGQAKTGFQCVLGRCVSNILQQPCLLSAPQSHSFLLRNLPWTQCNVGSSQQTTEPISVFQFYFKLNFHQLGNIGSAIRTVINGPIFFTLESLNPKNYSLVKLYRL